MLTAHRIALKPNNKQATYFAKAAGTARFAYNWALAEWQSQYDAWKQDDSKPKPAEASLRRRLNTIKRDRFPWMTEVTKNAPEKPRRSRRRSRRLGAGNALNGAEDRRPEGPQGAAGQVTSAV